MVVRFPLVCPLRVINAGDHGGITEEIHFEVLNVGQRRLEPGIFDIGQESLLVADITVPLCIDKAAGNQGVERRGIAVDLSFIPKALKNHDLALTGIGLLGSHCDAAHGQQKTAEDSAIHALTRSPHPNVQANVR